MDFAYLESFAAGDRGVIAEVLEMYCEQAALWQVRLAGPDADWRDVVHTIKGASRGIGATALGDVCERVEHEGEAGVPDVRAAVDAALAAIRGYLGR
jgi:HPt (histidine-containing phosphotransfer) domain-containing protein